MNSSDTNSYISGFVSTEFVNISDTFSEYAPLSVSENGHSLLLKAKRFGKWHVLKGLKSEYASKALFIELLNKEFDIAFSLDHPNIVRTISKEVDKKIGACIVMEYIDGITLNEFLKTNPDEKVKQKIVLELLDAMDYFHSKQVIHRDLKPENILITHNGNNVKIIDFGLSDTDFHDILKQPAGTLSYAAPEQKEGNVIIDNRADIYAFGKILQKMNLQKKCNPIIAKCTEGDRNKRYNSAKEIKSTFEHKKQLIWMPFVIAALIGIIYFLFLNQPNNTADFANISQAIADTAIVAKIDSVLIPIIKTKQEIVYRDTAFTNVPRIEKGSWEANLLDEANYKIDSLFKAYIPEYFTMDDYSKFMNAFFQASSKVQAELIRQVPKDSPFVYTLSSVMLALIPKTTRPLGSLLSAKETQDSLRENPNYKMKRPEPEY